MRQNLFILEKCITQNRNSNKWKQMDKYIFTSRYLFNLLIMIWNSKIENILISYVLLY